MPELNQLLGGGLSWGTTTLFPAGRSKPKSSTLMADSRQLQQVLWNLVHNAIKFTSDGGLVEIHIRRSENRLQIRVEDNGQGITPEFLPHVFERFRQQDSSNTRAKFGLGLGLSIAKHLVELHGGSIEARSNGIGHGATFDVLLPLSSPSGAMLDTATRGRTISPSG